MACIGSIRWKNVVLVLFLSVLVFSMKGWGQKPQPRASGFSPLPPVGAILAYVGQGELPPGWTVCDGKVIGEAHGFQKDQVDSFWWNRKVPDLNGRFLRGTTEVEQVAMNGGNDTVKALTTNKDGSHMHDYSLPDVTGRITEGRAGSGKKEDYGSGYDVVGPEGVGNHAHFIEGGKRTTPASQGSHQHNIPEITLVPKYTAVRYIIRIY
jgi:hypothetical protein